MKDVKELNVPVFRLFDEGWALVTCGTPESFNAMTVSWGQMGSLWGKAGHAKNVVTVFIRSSRRTFDFMEQNELFTVSFYHESCRKDLLTLGTKSGRDGDKVALTSLTAEPFGGSVTFRQARLTLLCRRIYRQEMDLSAIPADVRERFYDGEALHTLFIGEILDFRENEDQKDQETPPLSAL